MGQVFIIFSALASVTSQSQVNQSSHVKGPIITEQFLRQIYGNLTLIFILSHTLVIKLVATGEVTPREAY